MSEPKLDQKEAEKAKNTAAAQAGETKPSTTQGNEGAAGGSGADQSTSGPNPPVPTADVAKPGKKKSRPTLVVKGPASGRRRAGHQFGAEPVSLPIDELTKEQIEAIKGDPALIATEVDAPY